MASSSFHMPCFFTGTQDNGFFFQVEGDETDLQSDSFHKSASSWHWLIAKDNLFLSLAGGDQFLFEDFNTVERVRPDCKFIVQQFNESPNGPGDPGNRGRPVTLAAKVKDHFKVVSCGDTYDIKVETMDKLPEIIQDNDCCTLFYMKNICNYSEHYMFHSAAHKNHVLGFNQVLEEDGSPRKLVLRPYQKDEVDEVCLIDVADCC